MAAPNFLLAIIFMYAAYTWTGNAYVGLFNQDMLLNGVNWGNLGEFLKRCIMPVLIIALSGTCGGIRSMRALMLDELAQPYTLTARAKGVSERKITMKYCFRSALNPTVSGFAGMLSSFFTGSTITAIVMNLSLQGPVLYGALQNQDMYLAGTILFVQSLLVVLGTLLSDIALGWLDPKIRLEYTGG
jgi:peptide/nickel transport system permease protein